MAQRRDTTIRQRDAARKATATADKARITAVSDRDAARDTAQNALALRSLVTSDMVEEYDGINGKLWLHYRSTKVGKVWQQAQEDELLALQQAFSANQISMTGSS